MRAEATSVRADATSVRGTASFDAVVERVSGRSRVQWPSCR
jgi:hypothetical protein